LEKARKDIEKEKDADKKQTI